jgi:hypothetical protein
MESYGIWAMPSACYVMEPMDSERIKLASSKYAPQNGTAFHLVGGLEHSEHFWILGP